MASEGLKDIEIVEAILRLCGVSYSDGRDQSGKPFWFSSLRSRDNVHWHILFSPDGSLRCYDLNDPENVFVVGRPCEACTSSWGRLSA